MKDITINDQYGTIVLPDDNYAKPSIYDDVCVGDAYNFYDLARSGMKVNLAIDLGASYGVATRMIHHFWPKSRIIAFEPDPTRFTYLQTNCPSIEVRRSSVIGYCDDKVKRLTGIGFDGGPWRKTPEEYIEAMLSLGSVCSVREAFTGISSVDLLKIDVEGGELGILQEVVEVGTLPRVIRGEWHFANSRSGLEKLLGAYYHIKLEPLSPKLNPWGLFQAVLK